MLDLIIKNGKCYIDGQLKNQDIGIKDGLIQNIGEISDEAKEILNAEGQTILPGCIDTQTHFREPGSTDTEDLHSGSRAAIAGGITGVFEMPNTNPPTTSAKEFKNKLNLAKKRMFCNYAFYFGATPDNSEELANKARGFKNLCYGKENKFMHEDIGFNYRLPNVSAAMGLGQFNQITEIFKQKERIDSRYRKNLKDIKGLNIPAIDFN